MANPFDQFDVNPFDQFDKEAPLLDKVSTGIKSSFAGVGNMADTALSTLAGSAAALVGADKLAVSLDDSRKERATSRNQWANPDNIDPGFVGKLAGVAATLPMQIVGAGLSPADTVDKLLSAGETKADALKGGAIDAAGNAVGMLLPGFMPGTKALQATTGALLNAGQDYLTKLGIQSVAKTESGKKQFEPTGEDALISGIVGAGAGAMHKAKALPVDPKIDAMRKAQAERLVAQEQAKQTPAAEVAQRRATPDEIATQEALNRQSQYDQANPKIEESIVPDHTNQMELPFTDNPVERIAKQGIEADVRDTGQMDLFEHKQPDVVDPTVQKQQDIEAAYAERPQTDERVAQRVAEEENTRTQEQLFADLQQKLTETAYKPVGDGQGPKTRAAKREAMLGSRNRQRGGLLIDWAKKEDVGLDNASSIETIPKNPVAEEVVAKALAEGKDGKLLTYLQSGGTSAAMKTGSAAIKAASEIVQNAVKRADLMRRNTVSPAEHSLKSLSKKELNELGVLFKDEMFTNQRYDADLLLQNLSPKQLDAYTKMRDMFDETLAAQNAARVAKGQDPITARESYMSSRWQGDFRRPIRDAEGNLVWYLAADSKMGLEKQTKALLKQFPDLVVDKTKDHHVVGRNTKQELQSMYTTMLDILGRDDPAIAKIKEAVEQRTAEEAETTLAQTKHFERKGNIRGFVGDRPGREGVSETLDMFQQQLQYAENAFKWTEMQKAADDIKGIISDPDLQVKQPNNVKFIREYFKNAIGHGEAAAVRAVSNDIREGLGISPSVFTDALGNLKSVFITQKLAVSAGYSMANMIQTSNVLPYLSDLRAQGYKGNPVIALAVGVPAGMAMGIGHYMKSMGVTYTEHLPNQFWKEAGEYAEANGVTARSIYDEAPLENSFSKFGTVMNAAGKTMSIPETFVRSVAYMTYAQMLKDSGKFSDNSKLFQKAEELVNMSMVDYRETEKPLLFSKMGGAGKFMNTLQTFPVSFYNQYAYFFNQAKDGNPAPLLTAMALQYAVAGAMGIPYVDDADKLFGYIRDEVISTERYAQWRKSPLLSDPKLWLMETLGKSSVYGALSENTGLGLTSRVAAPGVGAMLQSPAGPIADLYGQGKNIASAVMDPTSTQKWAQVGMSSVPVGLQGLLETAGFMKDHTYVVRPDGQKVFMKSKDLTDREGKYARTEEEIATRKWGLRSQKEVSTSDITYATTKANQTIDKRSAPLVNDYYNAIREGRIEKAQRLAKLYVNLTGKEIQEQQVEQQALSEYLTGNEKTMKSSGTSAEKLLNAVRMKKLLENP